LFGWLDTYLEYLFSVGSLLHPDWIPRYLLGWLDTLLGIPVLGWKLVTYRLDTAVLGWLARDLTLNTCSCFEACYIWVGYLGACLVG